MPFSGNGYARHLNTSIELSKVIYCARWHFVGRKECIPSGDEDSARRAGRSARDPVRPWEVGFEMDRVISTVVTTRTELERGAMGANPLVLNVEREGIRP